MRKANEMKNNDLLLNDEICSTLIPQTQSYLSNQQNINTLTPNQNLNNQINDLTEINNQIYSSDEDQQNNNNYLTNLIQDISDFDNYGMLSYYYTTFLYLHKTNIKNKGNFKMNSNNFVPKSLFLFKDSQNKLNKPLFVGEFNANNNNLDNNINNNLIFSKSNSINNSIKENNTLREKNNKNDNIINKKINNIQSQIKNNK